MDNAENSIDLVEMKQKSSGDNLLQRLENHVKAVQKERKAAEKMKEK